MGKRKRDQQPLASDSSSQVDDVSSDTGLLDQRATKVRRTGRQHSIAGIAVVNDSGSDSNSNGNGNSADFGANFYRRGPRLSHVQCGDLAFPRSAYAGYQAPLPVCSEAEVLSEFEEIFERQSTQVSEQPDYKFIVLESFCVYRPDSGNRRPNELADLKNLQIYRGGSDGLLFDGVLRLGDSMRYVQGIFFKVMTVEGYGDPEVTDLSKRICIQTPLANRADVWYQLGRPAKEYERFYKPFTWLAEFAKHFVDYLLEMKSVTLDDFRFCFSDWLIARHKDDPHFEQWLKTCKLRDFRSTVAAHVSYLWNECCGLETDLLEHPIWGELDTCNLKAIPQQPSPEGTTVVTPFVYDMFQNMYFAGHLTPREVTSKERIRKTKARLGLLSSTPKQTRDIALLTPKSQRAISPVATCEISVGDAICLDADHQGDWKNASSTWYAYVQGVREGLLDVLWLYEPRHTTLGAAYYPFENELFMSDNCGCGRDAIETEHVKGKVSVSWFVKDPNAEHGLFVRQKFRTIHDEDTDDFVTLRMSDFECRCQAKGTDFEDCRMHYDIGDTVLVKNRDLRTQDFALEPALIVDFDLVNNNVVLRHLRRRCTTSNEVALTDVEYVKHPRNVVRRCHVRTFHREFVTAGLPTGYDREGAGDFYYAID